MKSCIAMAGCVAMAFIPTLAQATVWDLAADFSTTQNPNGAWSYGWRPSPVDPLVLYTDHDYPCSLAAWVEDFSLWCPNVVQNPHDYPVACCTWVLDPHKVLFHPGPAQQSVVRWTAPGELDVTVTTHFRSIDIGGKIVYVYVNGVQVYTATLEGLETTGDYTASIIVHGGDVVECAVSPISFYYDSTQVDFVLVSGLVPAEERTFGQVKAHFR